MIEQCATAAGLRMLRRSFLPPIRHWSHRVWDGDRAELHPQLGPAYQQERAAIADLMDSAVSQILAPADPTAGGSSDAPPPLVLGIDVACGTGRYTRELLRAGVSRVVCVDVSRESLSELLRRVEDPSRVLPVEGDVFDPAIRREIEHAVTVAGQSAAGEAPPPTRVSRIVVCCDAIHHLGDPVHVLTALRDMAGAGGRVIGDIWTLDRFHEFQHLRRGRIEAAVGAVRFAVAATVNAFVRRPVLDAARSLLLPSSELVAAISESFAQDQIMSAASAYWVRFSASL